jgi:hypothetical protein
MRQFAVAATVIAILAGLISAAPSDAGKEGIAGVGKSDDIVNDSLAPEHPSTPAADILLHEFGDLAPASAPRSDSAPAAKTDIASAPAQPDVLPVLKKSFFGPRRAREPQTGKRAPGGRGGSVTAGCGVSSDDFSLFSHYRSCGCRGDFAEHCGPEKILRPWPFHDHHPAFDHEQGSAAGMSSYRKKLRESRSLIAIDLHDYCHGRSVPGSPCSSGNWECRLPILSIRSGLTGHGKCFENAPGWTPRCSCRKMDIPIRPSFSLLSGNPAA